MDFVSIRVITDNVKRLADFYEQITGLPARRATEDFVELPTPHGTLAIASTRTIGALGPDSARPAENHTAIIEFRVEDVDKEYEKVKKWMSAFVKEPTTMPWGNRSMLFRDPDGNLVNFFTPLTAEAKARQSR